MFARIGLFLLINCLVGVSLFCLATPLIFFTNVSPGRVAGAVFAVAAVGLTGALVRYVLCLSVVRRRFGLRTVDPFSRDGDRRELHTMVERYARLAGLAKVPEITAYPSPEPNAFSVASSRHRALLAFSSGLKGDELEMAAAREVARIARGDTMTATLLSGIAGTLVFPGARLLARVARGFFPGDRGEAGLEFTAYHVTIFGLECLLLWAAAWPLSVISRRAHLRADRDAARLVSGSAMQNLLRALERSAEIPTARDEFITLRLRSEHRILGCATHPPIAERVRALSESPRAREGRT